MASDSLSAGTTGEAPGVGGEAAAILARGSEVYPHELPEGSGSHVQQGSPEPWSCDRHCQPGHTAHLAERGQTPASGTFSCHRSSLPAAPAAGNRQWALLQEDQLFRLAQHSPAAGPWTWPTLERTGPPEHSGLGAVSKEEGWRAGVAGGCGWSRGLTQGRWAGSGRRGPGAEKPGGRWAAGTPSRRELAPDKAGWSRADGSRAPRAQDVPGGCGARWGPSLACRRLYKAMRQVSGQGLAPYTALKQQQLVQLNKRQITQF